VEADYRINYFLFLSLCYLMLRVYYTHSIDLFVPTNALRQFFHCLLYYYDAPIRISAVILLSSGGILRSFYIDQFYTIEDNIIYYLILL
jgi:hypothetical protein